MGRTFAVLLAVLLLAGCGAGASLPIAASTQPQQATATTATRTPTLSPTVQQATASAEVTPTPEQTSTPEEEPPTPSPTASYPLVTITDLEPGPGRDIGIVAATDGKSIFYSNLFLFNDAEYDYICIYRFDPKTRKSKEIRRIPGRDYIIRQLFTDSKGSLLYFMEDWNNWMSSGIYQYSPSGDQLLVTGVREVVRVDEKYIIYYPQTDWDDDNPDRLMAYDLKNRSISQISNQLFDSDGDDISWTYENGQYKISIHDGISKQTMICSFSASELPIIEFEDSEVTNSIQSFVTDETLVLFVNSLKAPKMLYIYNIDIKKNKIVSKMEIPGRTDGGLTVYKGKIYFYSFELQDESTESNRKIQSYTISTGQLHTSSGLQTAII